MQAIAPPAIVHHTAVSSRSGVVLQKATRISSPQDPVEVEAEASAKKVVRMPALERSGPPLTVTRGSAFARSAFIQRKADGPVVSPELQAAISAEISSGSPLPASVRRFMEPRFNTSFSNVRVHTGDRAASLSRQVNAQAFTAGQHIFFARDRFRPEEPDGLELIGHELTHTIQQGEVAQHGEGGGVTQRSPMQVQRFGLSDILDWISDKAYNIPGFRMFTIILGVNPITMDRVERSAPNILRAAIEMIPGGALISQALDNHHIFEKVGTWVEKQLSTLGMTGRMIKHAIGEFLDSLGWRDLLHPGRVWDRAKRIFTDPIDRIIAFIKGLVNGIIKFIKDAILIPLAKLAEGTRGYDLLKAVLGEDPVTGELVPRTADTLIGGFMKLIGQEEVWQNLKKANAVARAWAWFQGALSSLLGFVRRIPGMFKQAFLSLELMDIILVPRAFQKVAAVFGTFIKNFLTWAGDTVWNLLEIIFEVVAPDAIPYLKKVAATFRLILKNPIGFVKNLVKAGIQGFQQFADNIGKHLKTSLIEWLTGSLPGVYIPQSFAFFEIVKFVFSVLGLTWANIRQKLVKAIGETAVKALEVGFDIVKTLVTKGPAAAWEKIQEQLANLKDMAINAIMDFVIETVVKKAVAKIISLMVPGGAFIQAIITIYDTIMVFIAKLQKIIQVAKAFLDSIVSIANGVIGAAANKVESTLAGLLTLAISFLAGFAGLGKIADKVMDIINTKIRQPIDKALDKVVDWIVKIGKSIYGAARGAVEKILEWWKTKKEVGAGKNKHMLYFEGTEEKAELFIQTTPTILKNEIASLKGDSSYQIPEKKTALEAADKLVEVFRENRASFAAANRNEKKTEARKLAQNIAKNQDDIRALLNEVYKDVWPTGSSSDPIPIKWFKPHSGMYPTLRIGTSGPEQGPLQGVRLPAADRTPERMLKVAKFVGVGDILARKSRGSDNPKDQIRGHLEKLRTLKGTDDSKAAFCSHFKPDYAIDHVQDLTWGGGEGFDNLWPLRKTENEAINASHNQQVRVQEDMAKPPVTKAASEFGNATFIVKEVSTSVPSSPGDHKTDKDNPINSGKGAVPRRI